MDPKMNELLKWSVEHSSTTASDPTAAPPARELNPEAMAALFGGPSDADLMVSSMSAIRSTDPDLSTADKLIAFDNFEQLIENLDNANNLSPLGLWTPLLECLGDDEEEIRMYAAWCVGTSVQNNEKCQERLLAMGGIEPLVKMALDRDGKSEGVKGRRKAVYALSSAGRNYQPAMDDIVKSLMKLGRDVGEVDASDMDACDVVMNGLREEAAKAA